MAPFMELVLLSQTGIHFPCLSMSQNFLTWHRTMCSLNSQFETKDIPLLHPGHQFLSKIYLRKSRPVKRAKLKTHLGLISDLFYTLYISPTRPLLRICAINFWARESETGLSLRHYQVKPPLPGQNHHYQVKTTTTRSKPPLPGQNRHLSLVQSCDLTRYIRTYKTYSGYCAQPTTFRAIANPELFALCSPWT